MNTTEPLLLFLATGLTKYCVDLVKFVCERQGWLCQWSPEKINLGMYPKAILLLTVPCGAVMTVACFAMGGLPVRSNLLFALCAALGAVGYTESMDQLKAKPTA